MRFSKTHLHARPRTKPAHALEAVSQRVPVVRQVKHLRFSREKRPRRCVDYVDAPSHRMGGNPTSKGSDPRLEVYLTWRVTPKNFFNERPQHRRRHQEFGAVSHRARHQVGHPMGRVGCDRSGAFRSQTLVSSGHHAGVPPQHESGLFKSLIAHLDARPWTLTATVTLIERQPGKNKTMKVRGLTAHRRKSG